MVRSRLESEPARPGFRLSTDTLPAHHRITVINRALEQGTLGSQWHALDDRPVKALIVECIFPGLSLTWAKSSAVRTTRSGPPALARNGDLIFFAAVSAPRVTTQFGREHAVASGEGLVLGSPGAADTVYPSECRHIALTVPRNAISPWLRDRSTHFLKRIPPDTGAMQLLVNYLDGLKDIVVPPELERSVVAHVHDLLAVILGATQDGAALARTRGVRAARLHAIKRDILKHLDGRLSVGEVAARHSLTARHLQRLFEGEGTTFTEFVREQRLLHARSMLASPRFDRMRIAEIAFEAGFSDLSYFNRQFVRRFGLSPGDLRTRDRRP
jgi:AraC-like DNA-binding protein